MVSKVRKVHPAHKARLERLEKMARKDRQESPAKPSSDRKANEDQPVNAALRVMPELAVIRELLARKD